MPLINSLPQTFISLSTSFIFGICLSAYFVKSEMSFIDLWYLASSALWLLFPYKDSFRCLFANERHRKTIRAVNLGCIWVYCLAYTPWCGVGAYWFSGELESGRSEHQSYIIVIGFIVQLLSVVFGLILVRFVVQVRRRLSRLKEGKVDSQNKWYFELRELFDFRDLVDFLIETEHEIRELGAQLSELRSMRNSLRGDPLEKNTQSIAHLNEEIRRKHMCIELVTESLCQSVKEALQNISTNELSLLLENHFKFTSKHSFCVICHVDCDNREKATNFGCKHAFHIDCIVVWMKVDPRCPICRSLFTEIVHWTT